MQILSEHWVFTLATTPTGPYADPHHRSVPPLASPEPGTPYCTPLFYALEQAPGESARSAAPCLIFASDPASSHAQHIGSGPAGSDPTWVGAAIYLETETVGQLRGAQMRGQVTCLEPGGDGEAQARSAYLARHPIAQAVLASGKHRLYRLRVSWAKLTDNRLGFGMHPIVSFEAGE